MRSGVLQLFRRSDGEIKQTVTLVRQWLDALNEAEIIGDLLDVVVCVTECLRRRVHIAADVDDARESDDLVDKMSMSSKKSDDRGGV